MKRLFILGGLTIVLLLLGCGPREEPAKEQQPTPRQQYSTQPRPPGEQLKEGQAPQERPGEPSAGQTMSWREQYQKDAEERLADLDRKIAELKEKAVSASAKTKARINKSLKNSDKLIADTKQKLGQLKEASAHTWEKIKAEIDKAFARLQKRYEEAMKS